ncbi:MAG TPA: WD40 repeat domain-containing protein [Caulobacteraceae bacterium]|nr:WD40 repeat domain-containing protein [Caulobacteraceae bacterium]
MEFSFDAYVTDIIDDGGQPVFALGDGTLRWAGDLVREAHDGAILSAAPHPSGVGVLTGGDDGRLVWSTPDESRLLLELPGRWIEALAVSQESGLVAAAAGKMAVVVDAANADFRREFTHAASVASLAFDAKGRRLAAATYGGVALWYARIAEQKPVMLRCAGSHLAVLFSPDGKFVVSAMQEPSLHGWRLSDGKDMAMSGYQSRVRGMGFAAGGQWLLTAGAPGLVLWPFNGANGPMGRQALQMDVSLPGLTARLAVDASGRVVAAASEEGHIAALDLVNEERKVAKAEPGGPLAALAVLEGGLVAWGDEAGQAGVISLADLPAESPS